MNLKNNIEFQHKLLEWYDHNARILPWRDNPSPYRVWISEIMLQQTRVETVKPYFERFIAKIPTIQELAQVPEDKLLKLWEGLGYYNRAMNLKKAAIQIIEEWGGKIPNTIEELKTLPGIGPYSAGAIASIAFGIRTSAIDGNVLRVFARITANKGDITNRIVKKEIEESVNNLLPQNRVGDFNQAIMELGATTCLPGAKVACNQCPVKFFCKGFTQGIATTLPMKTKKKPRKIEEKTILVINYEGTTALRQRPKGGLLPNLWEFPHIDSHLSYEECLDKMKEWNISVLDMVPLKKSKHIFTHLEWHMIGYFILAEGVQIDSEFIWATQSERREKYSIPSAFKAYSKFTLL